MIFKNPRTKPITEEQINVLINSGGIGDTLASIPALIYLAANHPWLVMHIWIQDFALDFVKAFIIPTDKITIRGHSIAHKKYKKYLTGRTTQWDNVTAQRIHPTIYSFIKLLDMMPTMEQASYAKLDTSKIDLSKFDLPEKYVVIPVAFKEIVKELSPALITQISKYLLVMKGIMPVYVGRSTFIEKKGKIELDVPSFVQEFDSSLGIDLTNKTSLLEVTAIMAKARAVIGMDGGLIHAAGFTDTPIIAMYTFVDPKNIMPIRNGQVGWSVYPVIPNEDLECRFCQSELTLYYNHDFRSCLRENDKFLCTKQIDFDKIRKEMDKVL